MLDGCRLIWSLLIGLFRSRATLEAENLVLRQQIIVLRRTAPKRLSLSGFDRLIFVSLCQLFPEVRSALAIVSPETVVRWHRAGFRAYWRWKSRPRRGRPKVPLEIRQLICEMSLANRLWGAPGFMANCLSSASISGRRAWPSTWHGGDAHRRRAGGRFCATMPTASLRWTCSWCQQSRSGFCTACSSCGMTGVGFCGWAQRRTRPRNGSPGS